jgi:hypothetical protein
MMNASRQYVSDRQYLYVIARDGSLRVVHVATTSEIECETNKDFGALDPAARQSDMNQACWPVTGPVGRRPGAIGPGIRPPTPPIDVAVADVRPTTDDRSETSVSGAHAWVLTASGATFLVNLDPVPRNINWVDYLPPAPDPTTGFVIPSAVAVKPCTGQSDCQGEPDPAPNTVRNRSFLGYTTSLDPSVGPPRLDLTASQPATGPRIESVWTLGSAANATALSSEFIKTQVYFPDPSLATPQTWAVTWEGNLMSGPRSSGQIVSTAPAAALRDVGADFCRLNVMDQDLVTLQGCTNTNQCGIGKECVFGSNGSVAAGGTSITGLCLAPEHSSDCDALLSTIRRYDVTSTRQHELAVEPHKDELVRRAGMPCTPTPVIGDGGAADGATDAHDGATDGAIDGAGSTSDAAGTDSGSVDGGADAVASPFAMSDCFDSADPTTAKFQCIEGRCLYPCSKLNDTSGCRAGRICVAFGTDKTTCAKGGCFCADAPPLDETAKSACVGELLPYQLSVGRGYLVSGSQTSLPATRTADPNGSGMCVPISGLDARANMRISIDADPCTNVAKSPEAQSFDTRCDPNLANPGCPQESLDRIQESLRRTRPNLPPHGVQPAGHAHDEECAAFMRLRWGAQRDGRLRHVTAPPARAVPKPRDPVHDDEPRTAAVGGSADSLRRARRVPAAAGGHPEHGRGDHARAHRDRPLRRQRRNGRPRHADAGGPVPLRRRPAEARALTGWGPHARPAAAHSPARLRRDLAGRGRAALVRRPEPQREPLPDPIAASAGQ